MRTVTCTAITCTTITCTAITCTAPTSHVHRPRHIRKHQQASALHATDTHTSPQQQHPAPSTTAAALSTQHPAHKCRRTHPTPMLTFWLHCTQAVTGVIQGQATRLVRDLQLLWAAAAVQQPQVLLANPTGQAALLAHLGQAGRLGAHMGGRCSSLHTVQHIAATFKALR
jgi:hypothetical protein